MPPVQAGQTPCCLCLGGGLGEEATTKQLPSHNCAMRQDSVAPHNSIQRHVYMSLSHCLSWRLKRETLDLRPQIIECFFSATSRRTQKLNCS